jgi:hypothetical protein
MKTGESTIDQQHERFQALDYRQDDENTLNESGGDLGVEKRFLPLPSKPAFIKALLNAINENRMFHSKRSQKLHYKPHALASHWEHFKFKFFFQKGKTRCLTL